MRILICDDNLGDHLTIEKCLNKYLKNTCIHQIFTSAELMLQIKNFPHRYDYIIVDQQLNSFKATDIIRLLEDSINGTKIYLMSGYDKTFIEREMFDSGITKITGFIEKAKLKEQLSEIFGGEVIGH